MVINVKAEYKKQQAAKKAATTKPAAPTPTVGGVPISVVPKAGQSYTPVAKPAASTSNFTYGSGNPQYVAPKPVVTPKPSGGSTQTKTAGVNQAALDASSARLQAQANAYFAANPDIDPLTGQKKVTPVVSPTPGKTVTRSVTNDDGTVTIFYSDGTSETFGTPTDKTPDVKKQLSPNIAYDTIQKILESYRITGLASVLESIREEYPEAGSDELITLLQFDSRYNSKFNERFAGNVARMKAGKSVYSPGEYLKLEQAFDKTLKAYNQPTFNNQTYYDKWIISDVDPVEVAERVQLGYDRVLSDDPVNRAFNKFYSALGYSDIVAGMLDPVNQLPALQQKVKAAEIGGAALRQGFKADEISLEATGSTLGADVLAKQGVTKAEAEQGYSRIASVLPTAQALSSIYSGQKEEQYGRLEAEQEQFQRLASAERKRKRLSELEMSQFRKSAGLGKGALGTTTNI